VFYQDLIESLARRRAPGLWTRLRGRGRAAFAKMTNRLPDLVRLTVFRDEGLRDARDLFATLAARGTAVSLVLSGEPGALREVAHWGGTCATTCCVSLLPGDAQDPAAPEAASWLLDHFIEISRALAGARAAGGTKAAA
jgi:hypothetical protein